MNGPLVKSTGAGFTEASQAEQKRNKQNRDGLSFHLTKRGTVLLSYFQ